MNDSDAESTGFTAVPATDARQNSDALSTPALTRRLLWGMLLLGCAVVGAALLAPGWLGADGLRTEMPIARFEVVNVYPHDPAAFSQGLEYHDGRLYEGTGQNGESSLRIVDLPTGRVLKKIDLHRQFFGEGITLFGDSVYQLTWKSQRAFVFDAQTLAYQKTFPYPGQGWGLTNDGTHLMMSDGSSTLRFLDPATFQEVRRVSVRDGHRRIDKLNELEYVEGEIYANIWHSDRIVRISPEDGRVVGYIDLTALWPKQQRPNREAVLNGIAYDEASKRLFITGKNWPRLYEIRVTAP